METKKFAGKINALGCGYLDLPVSGGEVGAKADSLTIMVGGPDAAKEIKPLIGDSVERVSAGSTRVHQAGHLEQVVSVFKLNAV